MNRMRQWTDARLLTETRAGHADAFGVFFERHHVAVTSYVRRRLGSADDAADLLSETFAGALLSVHRGHADGVADGAAWLVGIARNKLRESYRRGAIEASARAELQLERPALSGEDRAGIDEHAGARALRGALADLSPAELELLLQRIVLERDYDEIASREDLSEQVVRKRVSRALARVRDAMGAKA